MLAIINNTTYMPTFTKGNAIKTGKPGVLQFMGSQRVKHDLVTEQRQLLLHLVRILPLNLFIIRETR